MAHVVTTQNKVRIVKGKGVMSKDGKTPFAPCVVMVQERSSEMNFAVDYSIAAIMEALFDKNTKKIKVITADNTQFVITID